MNNSLNMIVQEYLNIEDPKDLIPTLLSLKKASMHMVFWWLIINKAIDELILATSRNTTNTGIFILGIRLELRPVNDDKDIPVAKQIISEHRCFSGAMNEVFKSAMARFGI